MKWAEWGRLAAIWGVLRILPIAAGLDSNGLLSDQALLSDSNAPGLSDDQTPAKEFPTRTADDYRASSTALPLDLVLGADLKPRQVAAPAASTPDRYTTVQVAAATKTETLLPVIGLDGQIVTPVVVPTSAQLAAAPTASISVVTAAPVTVTATETAQGATVTQTQAGPAAAVTVTQAETVTKPQTITESGPTETVTMTMTMSMPAAAAQAASPTESSAGASGGTTTPLAAEGSGTEMPAGGSAPPVQREIDPADGPFLGGTPTSNVDLPITLVFLALFAIGAFTHISIYRANSKRGHKFLLSDLVFDFCMIRSVTCIFRIIWTFISPRGVILFALIVENGGAVVLFVVQIFFVQRIVRSMHPRFGWNPAFRVFTLLLAFSVPAVIILNVVSISLTFFSVGNESRLNTLETLLKFGASWNMMLSVYPLVAILLASAVPGPRVERFGSGPFRIKIAIVAFAAVCLGTGAAVRLATTFNPVMPGTEDSSALFGKANFYTTGFMLEIFVVILFAAARIDLRFHVPNGTTAPGDYSKGFNFDADGKPVVSKDKLERMIEGMPAPYQLFDSTEQLVAGHNPDQKPLYAVFYPGPERLAPRQWDAASSTSSFGNAGSIPPRPERVSRRASVIEAFNTLRNTSRPPVQRLSRVESGYSEQWDYTEGYGANRGSSGWNQGVSDEKQPVDPQQYRQA